jgi:hypothetical protein
MAKSNNNVVTHGLSGKLGNMLQFTQRGGKTIVGKIADRSGIVPTNKQLQVQERFQEGVVYAKKAIADAATKALYEAVATADQSAFNLALADYCVAPDIKSVDVSQYAGVVGNPITVKAVDNFMVKSVKLEIRKANNSLIEQGDAVQDAANGLLWHYSAKTANTPVSGNRIIVKAADLPGNTTEKDTMIP